MIDDGSAGRPVQRYSLLTLLAVVTILALCLAIYRLNPRLLFGIVLSAAGVACAIWKARRYRRRGSRELLSEIAHLVLGPSVLLAVLMLTVGLGLIISCLVEYAG